METSVERAQHGREREPHALIDARHCTRARSWIQPVTVIVAALDRVDSLASRADQAVTRVSPRDRGCSRSRRSARTSKRHGPDLAS